MERARIPLPLAGGCQCGAVRYEIAEAPIALYACHCTECQRQSSSAFGMSMPVPRTGFAVTRGEPAFWQRAGESGRVVRCAFCPTCGTRLFHLPERNPAIVNVKAGTLDDTRWLEPVGHLWTRSRQRWVEVPEDAVRFDGQPRDFGPLYDAWRARFG